MKASSLQRLKTWAGAFCALSVLVSGGFFIGRGAGNRLMEGILLRETRFPLLLSRPVYQFYDIYTLLNSNNPYSRLSGYYSLVDANMIDLNFIRERYAREQVPVIQEDAPLGTGPLEGPGCRAANLCVTVRFQR